MSPKLRRYVASLPHTALLLQRLAARMPSHRLSVPRAGSGPAALLAAMVRTARREAVTLIMGKLLQNGDGRRQRKPA